MKPFPLLLPLLALVVIAGVTSALVATHSPACSTSSAETAQPVESARASSATHASVADEPASASRDITDELRGIKAELAALRRLIEDGAAHAGAVEGAATPRAAPSEWSALVRETELRLLVETISRQREHTRLALSLEEVSAADADSMAEVREASVAAVANLRAALTALDDVRSTAELAAWRERFAIETMH